MQLITSIIFLFKNKLLPSPIGKWIPRLWYILFCIWSKIALAKKLLSVLPGI